MARPPYRAREWPASFTSLFSCWVVMVVMATVESVEVVARVREEGARSRHAREVTELLCRPGRGWRAGSGSKHLAMEVRCRP